MNALQLLKAAQTSARRISSGGSGLVDFPTADTTGPRVSLVSDTSDRTPDPGVYDRFHFTNGLDLTDVTEETYEFIDCLVTGPVGLGYIVAKNTRIFTYCEIDGNEMGDEAVVNGGGFTIEGGKIHNGGQGISAQDFNLLDTWVGELYGSGDFHSEALLLLGSNILVDHCALFGNYRDTAPGFTGGMSSAVSLYTHGGFWAGHTDVLIKNSLLQSIDSTSPTVYWGTPIDDGEVDALVNCNIVNNKFRRVTPGNTSNGQDVADILAHLPPGSASVDYETGNVYEDDGSPILVATN